MKTLIQKVNEVCTSDRTHKDLRSAIKAGGYDRVNELFFILSRKRNSRLNISCNQKGRKIIFLGELKNVDKHDIESRRRQMGLSLTSLEDALLVGEQFPNLQDKLDGRGVVFFVDRENTIEWSGFFFYPVLEIVNNKLSLTLKQLSDPLSGYRYVWAYVGK